MRRAELAGALVHPFGEGFDTAGVIARQTPRHVVWTFHEQCAQQINPLVSVARLDVQFHRLG